MSYYCGEMLKLLIRPEYRDDLDMAIRQHDWSVFSDLKIKGFLVYYSRFIILSFCVKIHV